MNSLLFFQNEIVRQFLPGEVCELRLSGARAAYVRQWHSLSEGKEFPALLHQYGRGRASVATLSEQEICFTGRFEPLEIERLKVLAIVGVSRPQTVKKVIHSAVTFGVEELVLVGTERGEKSYLQSHSLAPDQILGETVRALEQATDPHPPAISLLKHFGELRSRLTLFCEHGGRSACNYVLDPVKDGESGGGQGRLSPDRLNVIAIGPEAGWSDSELAFFKEFSFEQISLGTRILRVENALSAVLGHISLLKCES